MCCKRACAAPHSVLLLLLQKERQRNSLALRTAPGRLPLEASWLLEWLG